MPLDLKTELGNERVPQRTWLRMPAIGMEAEFNVYLDGVEIIPEQYWKHPSAFIDAPLLHRTRKSSQIPTGGAVYFDRGVIEVVTPVIEIAEGCTARVVRNLWEQIGFVRDQLTAWERRTGHHVRLKAYSSHYNVSFEIPRREQNAKRNINRLALLLAHLLPIPVAVVGCNRRSTGVGVRPRGNRVEITVDFTPDPGLMIATATLIVGIVREVIGWPSYELSMLDEQGMTTIKGIVPGKHTTRKGWLTKDFQYPKSPYTADIDAVEWDTRDGRTLSLRQIAREVAWRFRRSIRAHSDPFSFRLLFAILEGRAPSMLELIDRPSAYEDVGRLCRWGMVIGELKSYSHELEILPITTTLFESRTIEEHIADRERERSRLLAAASDLPHRRHSSYHRAADSKATKTKMFEPSTPPLLLETRPRRAARATPSRRRGDVPGLSVPARRDDYLDRRISRKPASGNGERRKTERRRKNAPVPFPDRRLTRSAYEQVFLKLVSGNRLRIGRQLYTPIGMKGWYHAIFRREDGTERLLTIDQLLKKMDDWT
jgi:hypothetical protein